MVNNQDSVKPGQKPSCCPSFLM